MRTAGVAVTLFGLLGTGETHGGQTLILRGSDQADLIFVWKVDPGYRSYVKRGRDAPVVTDHPAVLAVEIDGGAGNDFISGRKPAMIAISGGVGADLDIPMTARGGPGNDILYGGSAGDRLFGGPGRDRIHGFDGNDLIHGNAGNDAVWGGAGNDTLNGGAGDDRLWGGPGRDTVFGDGENEVGDDVLFGGGEADVLFGGLGNDIIDVGSGVTNFARGGPDTTTGLEGAADRDRITGGRGRDSLRGGADRDILSGGDGDDRIEGGAGADALFGGTGDDVLGGGPEADYILGGENRDTIHGNEGCDVLDGGADDDEVNGDGGADWVFGGLSRDRLDGGDDDDRVIGGPGGDFIEGGRNRTASGDECRDCIVDGCNGLTCESTPRGMPLAFGAQAGIRVSYDPGAGSLAFEGGIVDWVTDSGALSQHLEDGRACHDRLVGLALALGDAAFVGRDPDGRYRFADVTIALDGGTDTPPVAGILTEVVLDPASGRFGGRLTDATTDVRFGSTLLLRFRQAVAAGNPVECSLLCADAGSALLAATNNFTRAGEASGSFTCFFDKVTGAPAPTEDCTSPFDDDGDGCDACDDVDCAQDPSCREQICDDAIDNDGDGRADCDDADCAGVAPCRERQCDNGIDDDADGLADCLDEDCIGASVCHEDCANGRDDNGTGRVDCDDPACAGMDEVCIEAENCADGIDNDRDGRTDCEDPQCVFAASCPAPEACCLGDGACQRLRPADCRAAQGTPLGFGSVCLGDADGNAIDDACEGACCATGGACAVATKPDCEASGGAYRGNGTTCLGDGDDDGVDDGCEGACCHDGACTVKMAEACDRVGGVYHGAGSRCAGDGNGSGVDDGCNPEGACCLPEEGCLVATAAQCAVLGGGYLGDFTSCLGDDDGDTFDDACIGLAANDCGQALPVSEGTTWFTTVGAGTDGPDAPESCDDSGSVHIASDIWYCFTATQDCEVTVSLCGSAFDTKLAVYDGCACPADSGRLIACNDDACGRQSRVSFPATAGSRYLIRIGSRNGTQGSGAMTLACDGVCGDRVCSGREDHCNCPQDCPGQCDAGLPDLIYVGASARPTIVTQRFFEESCAVRNGCVVPGWRKLMRFTAEARNIGTADLELGYPVDNPLFTFHECENRYYVEDFGKWRLLDTRGVVAEGRKPYYCLLDSFRHDPGANETRVHDCTNQGLQVGWADVYGAGLPCQWVDITDVPPGGYTLEMEINPDRVVSELDYDNNVARVPVLIPSEGRPPNDFCAAAAPVLAGLTAFTTEAAETDGPDQPGSCVRAGYTQIGSDVWYDYTATHDGRVTVSLCGSSYDTKLAVYAGGSCPVAPTDLIACDEDGCGLQSEVTFPAALGADYLIRIGGFGGDQGTGILSITCEEARVPALIKVCPGLGAGDPRPADRFDRFVCPKRKDLGLTRVEIALNTEVTLAGPLTWCTTATGGAIAPGVTDLVAGPDGVHTVVFDGPIPLGAWTTVTLTVVNACGQQARICFYLGHQPGDLDQDGETDIGDATVFGEQYPGGPTKLLDLDGNGQNNLNDATLFGQIWHGTSGQGRNPDGTGAWQGTGLPDLPACLCP